MKQYFGPFPQGVCLSLQFHNFLHRDLSQSKSNRLSMDPISYYSQEDNTHGNICLNKVIAIGSVLAHSLIFPQGVCVHMESMGAVFPSSVIKSLSHFHTHCIITVDMAFHDINNPFPLNISSVLKSECW